MLFVSYVAYPRLKLIFALCLYYARIRVYWPYELDSICA